MRTVANDYELEVTDQEMEVSVEIDYKCFISQSMCLSPMTVYATVSNNWPLSRVVRNGLELYRKEGYQRVEVKEVRIDD